MRSTHLRSERKIEMEKVRFVFALILLGSVLSLVVATTTRLKDRDLDEDPHATWGMASIAGFVLSALVLAVLTVAGGLA
jgi:hypothetical protein